MTSQRAWHGTVAWFRLALATSSDTRVSREELSLQRRGITEFADLYFEDCAIHRPSLFGVEGSQTEKSIGAKNLSGVDGTSSSVGEFGAVASREVARVASLEKVAKCSNFSGISSNV